MAGKSSRGPADVVAASTAASDIDGSAGRLFCRGYEFRPDSKYAGESERSWVPLDAR